MEASTFGVAPIMTAVLAGAPKRTLIGTAANRA
jgi:hypothetical protein